MTEGMEGVAGLDAPAVDDRSRQDTFPPGTHAGKNGPVESQDDARASALAAAQAEFKRATESPETMERIEKLRAEGHGIARHYDVTTGR